MARRVRDLSHVRRDSLLMTACDVAAETYRDYRTDDVYVANLTSATEVALGTRVCNDRRYCTVAFRGTESLADWTHNMMCWLVGLGDAEGRVHAGFYRRWDSVSRKVMRMLASMRPKRILIAGHSLGGAVATIAARQIAKSAPAAEVTVVTFGAPVCGDAVFSSIKPPPNVVRFVRCVHVDDMVSALRLPGYVHPKHAEVLLVGSGSSDGGDHVLFQQLTRIWRSGFDLTEHQIYTYRSCLAQPTRAGISCTDKSGFSTCKSPLPGSNKIC